MKDWRLRGQQKYLKNVALLHRPYAPCREEWDHDHCEFCGVKFSSTIDGSEVDGWSTEDGYHWVCNRCYEDFKFDFAWVE